MRERKGRAGGRGPAAIVFISGGLAAVAALAVRLWAGSPLPLLHTVGTAVRLPPLWTGGLLWFSAFFLLGCAAGTVVRETGGGPVRSAWRLRGGLYCLLAMLTALLWYPMLFRSALLWLSLPLLLLSCAAAVLCLLCWARLRRAAVLPVSAFCCLMLYLFVTQLTVIFSR